MEITLRVLKADCWNWLTASVPTEQQNRAEWGPKWAYEFINTYETNTNERMPDTKREIVIATTTKWFTYDWASL